jgi:CO/xanthine dehydrogenase Mo-binding subunit
METRASIAEILEDGQVIIHSTTQAPFVVRSLLGAAFNLPTGKITVITFPLGGGFGGKAGIQLEGLAYLLSKAVGGRPVRLVNSRENDLISSPGRTGLEAKVKLGCTKDGKLQAAQIHFYFDSGAYADYAVNISRAAAIACTGPTLCPTFGAIHSAFIPTIHLPPLIAVLAILNLLLPWSAQSTCWQKKRESIRCACA